MSLVGNLEDLELGDILQIVSLSRKSGVLYLRGEAGPDGSRPEGEIIFQHGQVIRATSTGATQNLGELLVAQGVITEAQLEEALDLQRADGRRERLGNLLIRHFGIPAETIQDAIRHQIEAIVFSFFQWRRGDFSFELKDADGGLDKVDLELRHLVLEVGLNPQFLAMEGTRLKDERGREGAAGPAVRPVPAGIVLRPAAIPPAAPPSRNGRPGPRAGAASGKIGAAPTAGAGAEGGPPRRAGTVDLTRELGLGEAAAAGAASSRGLAMLKAMLSELTNPDAHGQIALLILRFASELMRRAVLFLVKDDEVAGLGQFGIELTEDVPDRRVRAIRIPTAEPSIFAEALRRRAPYKGPLGEGRWDAYLVERLGGHRPVEVFCAPIASGPTIAAVLYADNAPDPTPIGDTESLEIFLYQAGLQMDKALLERKLWELNRAGR